MKYFYLLLTACAFFLPTFARSQPAERFRLDAAAQFFVGGKTPTFLSQGFGSRVSPSAEKSVAILDLTGWFYPHERAWLNAGFYSGWFRTPVPGSADKHKLAFGDVHFGIGGIAVQEQNWIPGVILGLDGSAPTAERAGLGAELWRTSANATLTESLNERIGFFQTFEFSKFVADHGLTVNPVLRLGGGISVGLTKHWKSTLEVDEFWGGKRTRNGIVEVPTSSQLQASLAFVYFEQGRPTFTLGFGAGNLTEKDRSYTVFLSKSLWSMQPK